MLRSIIGDDGLVATLRHDWRGARLDEADCAMLEYAEKLTRCCAAVSEEDVQALRRAGFDDLGVLQIAAIASFFNYINRMADGLGVGRG